MKKILCFGDSNTYGYIPVSGERYDNNTRWTGILKQKLSDKYEIIEGGCNNRNGFVDSDSGDELTGYKVLPRYMELSPDIVILAIGINDLQKFYRPSLDTVSNGLKKLVKMITDSGAETLLISPPILNNDILNGYFSFQFDEISIEMSKQVQPVYKTISNNLGCHFIDINQHVSVSKEDGLHYTEQGHSAIANVIYNYITEHFDLV